MADAVMTAAALGPIGDHLFFLGQGWGPRSIRLDHLLYLRPVARHARPVLAQVRAR